VRYFENALKAHINLRGDPEDARFVQAVERALGAPLPVQANTTSIAGDVVIYWLGPNEWLVVTSGDREQAVVQALQAGLEGLFSSVTVVSGGQTILVLRGPNVRDLVAKGCPFDVHPMAFRVGACAQSHLAKAGVLLRPLNDDDIEIIVRRSFADYLFEWLEVAAAEYGWVHAPEKAMPRAANRSVAEGAPSAP
jgi:sarcosine oxidase subunit gamma